MHTNKAEETLDDYLMNGVAKEIFWADESKAFAVVIGKHSNRINSKGFGDLFGSLQVIVSDRQTLAVAKIYDPESKRFPTRSIPAILSLIEKHASQWSLPQRHILENLIIDEGHDPSAVKGMDNRQLSLAVVAHFNHTLPHRDKVGYCSLSFALEAVREARNKVHAHNESVDKATRNFPTWAGVESLVDYAKDFVSVIGFGFLNVYMGSQKKGNYLLGIDARHLSRRMEELLVLANLNDDNDEAA